MKKLAERGTKDPAFDFFDLTLEDVGSIIQERLGLPPYRARQVFEWVYRKEVRDFERMTNISKDIRPRLGEIFFFRKIVPAKREVSSDGTRKYLFQFDDGNCVETVMVKQPRRTTLCVSSQVGCAIGCTFCRTATMGFVRNLTASEIVCQVLGAIDDAKNFDDTFKNIVFMGMGEPLNNSKNVITSLKILTSHHGLAIPSRKITVSTSGIVPAIEALGREGSLASLAVSLNATTDAVRSRIMPINDRYHLDELLECLRRYPIKGRKKITIEYVLIGGLNDTSEDLNRLPKLLKGIPCKINLIPYNENAGMGFSCPSSERIDYWYRSLCGKGVDATIRWSKGQDIRAACGQLASES